MKSPFKCNICNKAFKSKGALKHILEYIILIIHLSVIFAIDNVEINQVFNHSPFGYNNICNSKFKSKSGLNRHIKIHNENNAFKCNICNKYFTCQYTW